MGRILIVVDEPQVHRILASNLEQDNHLISQAASAAEALQAIAGDTYDVILTGQRMPDGDGLSVLAAAREADPDASVILLTEAASTELVPEAMRKGVFDFLSSSSPFEVIRSVVQRASDHTQLLRENSLLKAAVQRLEGASELFGETPVMAELRQTIARVAPMAAAVLITGEVGTGKELVARAIHRLSPRAAKPFLTVNCAAFSETSLESELFGCEGGAFAGADRSRLGLFEAAHEGTLFLDDVAEVTPVVQARLLRVLIDGQVMRVGSTKPRTVDVRVLAATHRDLPQRVSEGLFREDLYSRLAMIPIAIPPLRQHTEDIAPLCDLFLKEISREMKVPERRLSASAISRLQAYDFPGNIRELRNLIERSVMLSSAPEIEAEHFPLKAATPVSGGNGSSHANLAWIEALPPSFDLRRLLSAVEKSVIERTLAATRGAQAEAARRLGLSRSDLSYKLLKYELRKETVA